MRCNHLLPKRIADEPCPDSKTGEKMHSWTIVNDVRAMLGGFCNITLRCERCQKRYNEIYSKEDYETKIRPLLEGLEDKQCQK